MAITCRESVETTHYINFDTIGNVDIRLHRLVITIPSPFHYDVWRYSQRKSLTDKVFTSCMSAKKFILRVYGTYTIVSLIVRDPDFSIYSCGSSNPLCTIFSPKP